MLALLLAGAAALYFPEQKQLGCQSGSLGDLVGQCPESCGLHIAVEMLNHPILYSVHGSLGMGYASCGMEGTGGFFLPSTFSLLQAGHRAGRKRF